MHYIFPISLIVPIGSVDSYTFECLDSIFSQYGVGIEVIFISSESNLEKIKHFLSNFQYNKQLFKIVFCCSFDTESVATRRNRGIEISTGEFIAFIDSDDFFYSRDSLYKLYKAFYLQHHTNILVVGGSCVIKDHKREEILFRDDLINNTTCYISYKDYQNESGFYRFLYKKDLIKNTCFKELKRFQDSVFMFDVLLKANNIFLIPDIVYVYRKEHKTYLWTLDSYKDHLKGVCYIYDKAYSNKMYSLVRKMLLNVYNTRIKRKPLKRYLKKRYIEYFEFNIYVAKKICNRKIFFLYPKELIFAMINLFLR